MQPKHRRNQPTLPRKSPIGVSHKHVSFAHHVQTPRVSHARCETRGVSQTRSIRKSPDARFRLNRDVSWDGGWVFVSSVFEGKSSWFFIPCLLRENIIWSPFENRSRHVNEGRYKVLLYVNQMGEIQFVQSFYFKIFPFLLRIPFNQRSNCVFRFCDEKLWKDFVAMRIVFWCAWPYRIK